MSTAILIPARLQSSRLANKMLVELDGKPLIQRVFDICNQTDFNTYVVTDSLEIAELCPNFILTDSIISVSAAIALFAIPINFNSQDFVLKWKDTKNLSWGILLLF